jgi:hypothetical protein
MYSSALAHMYIALKKHPFQLQITTAETPADLKIIFKGGALSQSRRV